MDKKKLILVAEDDAVISNVIEIKFERAGFLVLVANDGLSAWEYLKHIHVDLLVTDHAMPKMTGVELCERIRNHPVFSALPIIMLTARKHELPIDFAIKSRIEAVISKPFSPNDLLNRAMRLLEAVG